MKINQTHSFKLYRFIIFNASNIVLWTSEINTLHIFYKSTTNSELLIKVSLVNQNREISKSRKVVQNSKILFLFRGF